MTPSKPASPPTPRGRFIAIEGIDGAGKSTLARALAEALGLGPCAALTSEPSRNEVGRFARACLEGQVPAAQHYSPQQWAALFVADRLQHARDIHTWLLSGRHVVCDRYALSTLVYQGWGRGDAQVRDYIRATMRGPGYLEPDLTVWVDVPIAVAAARMGSRAEGEVRGNDAWASGRLGVLAEGYREEFHRLPEDRRLRLDGLSPVPVLVAAVVEALDAAATQASAPVHTLTQP